MIFKKLKNEYRNMDKISRIELNISHILRFMLIIAIFGELLARNWLFLFLTVLSLALTFIPALIEKNYRITLPSEFELALVFFIFAGIYLGEVRDFYVRIEWWDSMLHAVSGIVLGLIGFTLVYILYSAKKIKSSPFFVAVFTFSFALALGAIWEIFEFIIDNFTGTNMQRAQFTLEQVKEYGSTRIAVQDTMKDLIIDSAGALLTAFSGYFYVKNGDSLLIKTLLTRIYSKNNRSKKT